MEIDSSPIIVSSLGAEQKKMLDDYANVLDRYTRPVIRDFSPIGWRKIPKVDRLNSERVSEERFMLERKLGIRRRYCYGNFRLEMVANLTRVPFPEKDMFRPEIIRNLFPLKSDNEEALKYLANEALPRVFTEESFPQRRFAVYSNFVKCQGGYDCCWDTR